MGTSMIKSAFQALKRDTKKHFKYPKIFFKIFFFKQQKNIEKNIEKFKKEMKNCGNEKEIFDYNKLIKKLVS
jgi:hypothetical protein